MNKKIAIVLHIEGAEAIDRNFYSLEKLYDLGLRSIGLVWSRPNIFGNGGRGVVGEGLEVSTGLECLEGMTPLC